MTDQETECCSNCKFSAFGIHYEQNSSEYNSPQWYCRKNAPTMIAGAGAGWSNQLFPIVRDVDWCGEYEKGK